jgi:hypothetical protein
MAKQANADDYVAFQGQLFLSSEELIAEPRTAAQGYNLILIDHY